MIIYLCIRPLLPGVWTLPQFLTPRGCSLLLCLGAGMQSAIEVAKKQSSEWYSKATQLTTWSVNIASIAMSSSGLRLDEFTLPKSWGRSISMAVIPIDHQCYFLIGFWSIVAGETDQCVYCAAQARQNSGSRTTFGTILSIRFPSCGYRSSDSSALGVLFWFNHVKFSS